MAKHTYKEVANNDFTPIKKEPKRIKGLKNQPPYQGSDYTPIQLTSDNRWKLKKMGELFDEWCEKQEKDSIGNDFCNSFNAVCHFFCYGCRLDWLEVLDIVNSPGNDDSIRLAYDGYGSVSYFDYADNLHSDIWKQLRKDCTMPWDDGEEFGWVLARINEIGEEQRLIKKLEDVIDVEDDTDEAAESSTFPIDVFDDCPVLKEITEDFTEKKALQYELFALPALVCFSSFTGAVHTSDYLDLSCNTSTIYGMTVGESGVGKTQGARPAERPYAIIDELIMNGESNLSNTLDPNRFSKANDLSNPDNRPNLCLRNPTPHSLKQELAKNARGLIWIVNEFGTLLQQLMTPQWNNGIDMLCDIWDGETIKDTTKTATFLGGSRLSHIARPALSVIGGIQPENLASLRAYSALKYTGWFARFIHSYVELPDVPDNFKAEDIETEKANRYEAFISYAYSLIYWNQKPGAFKYTFAKDAQDKISTLVVSIRRRCKKEKLLARLLCKCPAYVVRLSVLLHVMKQVYENFKTAEQSKSIDVGKGVFCGCLPITACPQSKIQERIEREEENNRRFKENMRELAESVDGTAEKPETITAVDPVVEEQKADIVGRLRQLIEQGRYSLEIDLNTVLKAIKIMEWSFDNYTKIIRRCFPRSLVKANEHHKYVKQLLMKKPGRCMSLMTLVSKGRFRSMTDEEKTTVIEEMKELGIISVRRYDSGKHKDVAWVYLEEE